MKDFDGKDYKIDIKDVTMTTDLSRVFPDTEVVKGQQITNVGVYSITLPEQAETISSILTTYVKAILGKESNLSIITDGTACVGGNTISFAKYFGSVISNEICPIHKDMLDNNVKAYALDNVTTHLNDYTKIMLSLHQDVIFLSPPWGGSDYRRHKEVNLFLGKINLVNIVNKLIDNDAAKIIACMVPSNFNFNYVARNVHKVRTFSIHTVSNFYLIVFTHPL